MTVRKTSAEAYWTMDGNGTLSKCQREVMLFFHGQPKGVALTRRAISDMTGIPPNAVPRHIQVLIERGYLEELPEVVDPVTGFRAHPVRIRPIQLELAA